MAYDGGAVTDILVGPEGSDLLVSWRSAAPAGTVFQVHLDGVLVRATRERSVRLPHPAGPVRVDVGAVGPGEAWADFRASLPPTPGGGRRLKIAWLGGTFLGPTVAGYHVYLADTPGGPVDTDTPVARVAAYSGPLVTDGYGLGGYGLGGYGLSAASYSWVSGVLAPGAWAFAVAAFDTAGEEWGVAAGSATVAGPPRAVPPGPDGTRVSAAVAGVDPGGYGAGGYGVGGYGTGTGYGLGGYGLGPYGTGGGGRLAAVTLTWLAPPP